MPRTIYLFPAALLFAAACSSGPQPIPYSATRVLVAKSPVLAALEPQIAAKKIEQDRLEERLTDAEGRATQNGKDENLKKQLSLIAKENELCQAELAALISRHQLESARALNRLDIAEHEKAVAKQDEVVANRRKALAEVGR